MSNIQLGLTRTHEARAMKLSERDVGDAVRLLNLLLSGQALASRADVSECERCNASPSGVSTPSLKAKARAILQQRRSRAQHFSPSMFSEPAWDMLLVLFASEDSERRLTITTLVELSGAPSTTALRWLTYLEQAKLVARQPSSLDRRIAFVSITPLGTDQMNAYLGGLDNLQLR